jgi:hypothetical protein
LYAKASHFKASRDSPLCHQAPFLLSVTIHLFGSKET